MKRIPTLILFSFFSMFFSQKLPNISINSMSGEKINVSTLDSSEPIVLSFWATWCLPCMEELTTIDEKYEAWQKEVKFRMFAVSTDDPRTSSKVKTVVKSKGWSYEVLMDTNNALKRGLNVNTIPHIFIIHNGKVVYSHVGYSAGDEDELFSKIKECYASK